MIHQIFEGLGGKGHKTQQTLSPLPLSRSPFPCVKRQPDPSPKLAQGSSS